MLYERVAEVDERVAADGRVMRALDEEGARRARHDAQPLTLGEREPGPRPSHRRLAVHPRCTHGSCPGCDIHATRGVDIEIRDLLGADEIDGLVGEGGTVWFNLVDDDLGTTPVGEERLVVVFGGPARFLKEKASGSRATAILTKAPPPASVPIRSSPTATAPVATRCVITARNRRQLPSVPARPP